MSSGYYGGGHDDEIDDEEEARFFEAEASGLHDDTWYAKFKNCACCKGKIYACQCKEKLGACGCAQDDPSIREKLSGVCAHLAAA